MSYRMQNDNSIAKTFGRACIPNEIEFNAFQRSSNEIEEEREQATGRGEEQKRTLIKILGRSDFSISFISHCNFAAVRAAKMRIKMTFAVK